MSGAATSCDSEPTHYVSFGKDVDDETNIYFEFDDQRHGGYGRVRRVVLTEDSARFELADGDTVTVIKQMDDRNWAGFLSTIEDVFGAAVSHGA